MKVYREKTEYPYVASMLTPRIAERKCFSESHSFAGSEIRTAMHSLEFRFTSE